MEDTWKGCTPDGLPPVVGKRYKVNHSRKGEFWGTVVRADDVWATIEIDKGVAKAMLSENEREAGEQVTCRNSLCKMIPA